MVQAMQDRFPVDPAYFKIFFGPCSKVCCYEVGQDFNIHLEAYSFAEKVLQMHNNSWFFDLPGFVYQQLKEMGIKKEAINSEYNACTICNEKFFSFRREGGNTGRQMTVVSLK